VTVNGKEHTGTNRGTAGVLRFIVCQNRALNTVLTHNNVRREDSWPG
jgi:hypothetical protein